MRLNFCTVFNTNYFSKGLALYRSLEVHADDFHLYIIGFDTPTCEVLKALKLEHATIISLNEFESEELLKVKPSRSFGEYCWTCTSSAILYCLDTYKLDHCTYLDADLYFFSNPVALIEEAGNNSVIITEHRYTPEYDQSEISGKYCVQFMYFKNNQEARICLNWWIDACIDWCYAKPEDGKFGDQKYLDDWCTRFSGIHELQHLGGGMAPWNIQQFEFKFVDGKVEGLELSSKKQFDLVFYHFHDLFFYFGDEIDFGNYVLSQNQIDLVYKPYIQQLVVSKAEIQKIKAIDSHGTKKNDSSLRGIYRRIKRRLFGNYNRYPLKQFLD